MTSSCRAKQGGTYAFSGSAWRDSHSWLLAPLGVLLQALSEEGAGWMEGFMGSR